MSLRVTYAMRPRNPDPDAIDSQTLGIAETLAFDVAVSISRLEQLPTKIPWRSVTDSGINVTYTALLE